MSYDDKKFGPLWPRRTGTPLGTAGERGMLDAIGGSEGFRKRLQNNPDGSVTRLTTKNGQPQFTTSPTDGLQRLPHGFLVTSAYSTPMIYRRVGDGSPGVWGFADDTIPQAAKTLRATNQAFVPPGDTDTGSKAFVHPAVLTKLDKVWDWARHAGAPDGANPEYVPINLVVRGPPRSRAHHPHYAVRDKIVNLAGTTLFQMTDAYPGWLPLDERGAPATMTPATDSTGMLVGLFTFRERQIPATERYNVQYRNVLVKRTDPEVYVADGAHEDNQFIVPLWSAQYTAVTGSTTNLDGEVAPQGVLAIIQTAVGPSLATPTAGTHKWASSFGSGWQWITYGHPDNDALVGYTYFTETPLSKTVTTTLDGYTDKEVTQADAPTVLPVARLPWTSTAMNVSLSVNVSYPVDRYMRGGTATASFSHTPLLDAQYGVDLSSIDRRDSRYKQTGAVGIELTLPGSNWNPALKLFEGSSLGDLTGSKRLDTHQHFVSTFLWGGYMLIAGDTPAYDPWEGYEGLTYTESGGTRFYDQNGIAADTTLVRFSALAATLHAMDQGPRMQAIHALGSSVTTDVDTFVPPSCVGNYDYTSRYIIDFDLRALFYAAIVVRVQCTGARWDQSTAPGAFVGQLAKTSDPSYTVTISLETDTDGTKATKVLLTGTCTRPAFEFDMKRYTNPFRYPYIDSSLDLVFYMPPQLSPTVEFYRQLRTLSNYQGSNPHLAGEDFFKDENHAPLFAGYKSSKGIEYSYLRDGVEIPHNKYVQGTLYARTFKLSDFPDALWMLHSLKMDAPLDNIYPQPPAAPAVMWYYLPAVGAAIANTEYSVEARDGVIFDWTVDIVPNPGTTVPPLKSDRNIKLYRI